MVSERREVKRTVACELVSRADGRRQLLAGELEPLDLLGRLCLERESHVDLAFGQHVEHAAGGALADADFDFRKGTGESGQDGRNVQVAAKQQRPDRDPSSHQTAKLVDFAL